MSMRMTRIVTNMRMSIKMKRTIMRKPRSELRKGSLGRPLEMFAAVDSLV
jgi:hypothetical protein